MFRTAEQMRMAEHDQMTVNSALTKCNDTTGKYSKSVMVITRSLGLVL
jgi:hypothetical protein